MKTILLAVLLATAGALSAQIPPCPGACPTDADLKYWAAKESQAHADAREDARLAAIVAAADAQIRARREERDDSSNNLLQLRIVSAYPNNPAMWQWLNRNPHEIPRYLGER